MHVLLIDHSKVFKAILERMVLRLGHEPISVASAEEAAQVVRERHVDLVCVSLSLPGMDGISFTRKLREQPQHSNIPVFLLTSKVEKDVRTKGFDAGVTEFHDKANVDALVQSVKNVLSAKKDKSEGRVLYVEDSPVAAHIMMRVLKGLRLEVDHFRNATEAADAFTNANYDLIISDILVEGKMTGVELVRQIREMSGEKAKVPILALSGNADPAQRGELFKLGVSDFVSKPALEQEVRARVANLIANKQLRDQVQSQQRRLYELSMIDQLTSLYNRNSLNEFAPKYFSEAARHDWPLTLLLVDLDEFRTVNEKHGHLTGDAALSAVGELLKNQSRREDFAARYDGDEFILIMPHCQAQDALRRAEQWRGLINKLNPEGVKVSASIGICARPKGSAPRLEDLFNYAERAVLEAKRAGGDRVMVQEMPG